MATNEQGRSWLRGLLRHREKWTRAYDEAGWRYSFQTSNMAESFNSVLKGIRGMPVNAIVDHIHKIGSDVQYQTRSHCRTSEKVTCCHQNPMSI